MSNNMSAEEKLLEYGYEGIKYLVDESYDSALIGVTSDDRAVYDYDLMIQYLMDKYGIDDYEAEDWVSYDTIRALPYMGAGAPVVIFRFPESEYNLASRECAKITGKCPMCEDCPDNCPLEED